MVCDTTQFRYFRYVTLRSLVACGMLHHALVRDAVSFMTSDVTV
jgi:hypothetical protein